MSQDDLVGTEEGGFLWDEPASEAALAARAELHAMVEALKADREAGYPSERGRVGRSDTGRPPALRLVT